jgi:hypothetical protein
MAYLNQGKDADRPVYALVAALSCERRAIREQLAKQLGQWAERTRVDATVSTVEVTRDALQKLSTEELREYERLVRASRRREDLLENALEQPIKDFLVWRGFISIRQHRHVPASPRC